MPTPMHVSIEIAARFNVDTKDHDAVLAFFSEDIYKLPLDMQKSIFEEVLDRDGEQPRKISTNMSNNEDVPLLKRSDFKQLI